MRAPSHGEEALVQFDRDVRRAIDRFSWFIYRMNRPAPRDLFMGSGTNISSDQRMPSAGLILGRRQYRIPDGGRTSIFEAQPTEVELSLVNPAKQFDAGNCDRRGPEPLEAKHRTDA
jgi:hypothetical protein